MYAVGEMVVKAARLGAGIPTSSWRSVIKFWLS